MDTVVEQVQRLGGELPCRQVDPEVFFAEQPARIEQAKSVCVGCGVREPCLQGALQRAEPWGVWGGEIFQDGVVIEHKRGRGRPRTRGIA